MMREPFFIVGFQRSGTTLLRVMLDAHPDIAIPLDTVGLWSQYEGRLPRYGGLGNPDARRTIVEDLLREERIALWGLSFTPDAILARWATSDYPGLIRAFYESYASAHGKSMWGDKDPGNMVRIDQLTRWFPHSRIIHIVRDGRDACLSQLEQSFGFDDLLECACEWREQVQWVRRMGAVMTDRYHEVKYEDLVVHPSETLRRISEFLEIPYQESMLQYMHQVSRSVPESKRHIWPMIDQAPRADNAGRWRQRMSSGTRICFEKRAYDVLRESGYDVLPTRPGGAYLREGWNLLTKGWKALRRRVSRRRVSA
jgi:hypothetical protein